MPQILLIVPLYCSMSQFSRVCFALDNVAKLLKKKPSAMGCLHPRVIIMYPGDTETSGCKQKGDRRTLTQVAEFKEVRFRSNVVFIPLDALPPEVPPELGANFSVSQMNLQTEFVC